MKPLEERVRAFMRRVWHACFDEQPYEALDPLLDGRFSLTLGDGVYPERADAVAALRARGAGPGGHFETEQEVYRSVSLAGGLCLAYGAAATRTLSGGKNPPFCFTALLLGQDGGFLLLHLHLSPAGGEPGPGSGRLEAVGRALDVEKERGRVLASFIEDRLFEYDIASGTLYNLSPGKCSRRLPDFVPHFRSSVLEQEIILPKDSGVFASFCDCLERGEREFTFELRGKLFSEEYSWARVQGKTICSPDGAPLWVLGRIADIDEQKREVEGLLERAQCDALTGLYNRASVERCVKQALEQSPEGRHAFLLADIDGFRRINDRHGHLFGDAVLSEVAGRLRSTLRDTDVIGRVGGDKFAIFFKNFGSSDALRRKARELCDLFRRSGPDEERQQITGCVGVARYPQDGTDYSQLFEHADAALYAAKRRGRDGVLLYSGDLPLPAADAEPLLDGPDLAEFAFDLMSQTQDADSAIHLLLSKIGRRFGLSRACILEIPKGGGRMRATYEWCGAGTPSCKIFLQDLPLEPWMKTFYPLFRDGMLDCPDTSRLPLSEQARNLYSRLSTRAQFQHLIREGGALKGTLCYDMCDAVHTWTPDEIRILSSLTKIISSYLLNMRTKQQLESRDLITDAVARNQNLFTYVLRPDSYELVYISPNTQALYPQARPGDLCYRALWRRGAPCEGCPLRPGSGGVSELYNEHLRWWVNISVSNMTLENGEKTVLVCFSNITSFRRRMLANDSLTGLSSMTQFEADAVSLLKNRGGQKYALVSSDFDKFKYINEARGYQVGNQVLIACGRTLLSLLRPGELACRHSSDLFVCLLRYEDPEELRLRLCDARQRLTAETQSVAGGLGVSMSSGIYLILPRDDSDLAPILDRANIARKSVKGSHQSHCAYYDAALHSKVTREKEIELMMAPALRDGEFIPWYQPKISLRDGRIAGAEALVRWMHESGQPIMPGEFIPVLEKNGFIRQVDYAIHEQVFGLMRRWLDEGRPAVPISVNVSRVDIQEDSFVPSMRALRDRYRIPRGMIELELTESVFLRDMEETLRKVQELRELGFPFSIDDFGSGYSSLNLLRRMPIDVLKLDQGFFDREHSTARERSILSGVIQMAKSLQITVLSEGVETQAQADFLREAGCDLAQGYLYARPMPAEEFLKLLEARKG